MNEPFADQKKWRNYTGRWLVSGLISPVDADLLWEKNTVG